MSKLMLHGRLNSPVESGDFVGFLQLKVAAKDASSLITQLEADKAELLEALNEIERMQVHTPELPEDYEDEDVAKLNDRIDEIFGLVNTVINKHKSI